MKEEWNIYRNKLRESAKTVFLALGISILFYFVAIPNLKSGEHLQYFLFSLLYGLVIYTWIWTLYAGLRFVLTKRKIKPGKKSKFLWRVHIPIILMGTVGGLLSARWLEASILNHAFRMNGLWEGFLTGSFIGLMFLFYYSYKSSVQENRELQAAKTQAELHVLKNQMQPHFLFNSLNSLAELIESNKDTASTMTQNLADLYREILENSKLQLCTVESELSIIQKYLALEKLRFGERLTYQIDEPSMSASCFIPSLILQTLVENAVKHGVAPSIHGGKIHVKIEKLEEGFKAQIHNTGSPMVSPRKNKGTGLENTKSRLDLLYGEQHQFKIESHPHGADVSFWFSGDHSVH
jgi:hypothetical protein